MVKRLVRTFDKLRCNPCEQRTSQKERLSGKLSHNALNTYMHQFFVYIHLFPYCSLLVKVIIDLQIVFGDPFKKCFTIVMRFSL